MILCEHPDFDQILIAAAAHFAMPVQIVEKDYFVTEALRKAHDLLGARVIFKGGTSLSKGWKLIPRFSEDIDLFVDPAAFSPPLKSRKRVDKTLKTLRDAVAVHPALSFVEHEGLTVGGSARHDFFAYRTRFTDLPGIRAAILVEAGTRSGAFPTEVVDLRSYASEFLATQGLDDIATDIAPFPMTLLHFRRTYVEKLFALHDRVERLRESGGDLGREARHYADLHLLGQTESVQAMLRTAEFGDIKRDCLTMTERHFPHCRTPKDLSFAQSAALFPDAGLKSALGTAYDRDCAPLFFGPYPSFDEVLAGFEKIRALL